MCSIVFQATSPVIATYHNATLLLYTLPGTVRVLLFPSCRVVYSPETAVGVGILPGRLTVARGFMSAMASRNSPPSPPPPPLSPPHHPSPSPPSPPPSPGQPPAPRTEDKSSSVSSEDPAGPPEVPVIPVDEPPSHLTVDQSSHLSAIKVDKSLIPGPPPPPNTEVDKSYLGIQGASGFTVGDTSFVTPMVNPKVPLSPPSILDLEDVCIDSRLSSRL